MKKTRTIVGGVFPWLDRTPKKLSRPIMEDDMSGLGDVDRPGPNDWSPGPPPAPEYPKEEDEITKIAEEFLSACMSVGQELGFRTEYNDSPFEDEATIRVVTVSFFMNPNDQELARATMTVMDRDSKPVKVQYGLGNKKYQDGKAFYEDLTKALTQIVQKPKLQEFKRMLGEMNFSATEEFKNRCQLLSSKYHTYAPLYTETDGIVHWTIQLKSPATVTWRGKTFTKETDDVYEIVLTLAKAELSGNVKTNVDGHVVNHPIQVFNYRIANDQGWEDFFTTVDKTIHERDGARAAELDRAGLVGSLPETIDESFFSKPKPTILKQVVKAMEDAGFTAGQVYVYSKRDENNNFPPDIKDVNTHLSNGDLLGTFEAKGFMPVYLAQYSQIDGKKYTFNMFCNGEHINEGKDRSLIEMNGTHQMVDYIRKGAWKSKVKA